MQRSGLPPLYNERVLRLGYNDCHAFQDDSGHRSQPTSGSARSVLLVSRYRPGEIGGIETHLRLVLAGLGNEGVVVDWVGCLRRPRSVVSGAADGFTSGWLQTIRAIRSKRWSCVHVHGFDRGVVLVVCLAVMSCRGRSIKLFITPHNGVHGYAGDPRPWRRWVKQCTDHVLFPIVSKFAEAVVQISEEEQMRTLARFGNRGFLPIVANPIEAASTASIKSFANTENLHSLLVLGRVHPGKRIEDVLIALSGLHTNMSLVVAGPDGGALSSLRELAARLNVVVQFVGPVVGEDKWKLIISSSALVLPSVSEGVPTVALEALSAGVPVIASEAAARSLPRGGVIVFETGNCVALRNLLDRFDDRENPASRNAYRSRATAKGHPARDWRYTR